jgi:hypothetical protein
MRCAWCLAGVCLSAVMDCCQPEVFNGSGTQNRDEDQVECRMMTPTYVYCALAGDKYDVFTHHV